MDLGLKDKVALVSGGTSGIGLAVSRRLSEEGCRLALAGRRQAKLDRALAQIDRAQGFIADVCDPVQVSALVDGVVEDVETSALLHHLETKVMGAWGLAKCVVPHMRRQGGGRFIVIIGQAGKVPQANGIASTISNAAQHALVKSLSDDLARDNILVNAVCPSRIKTPLTDGLKLHNEVFLGRSLEQQESRWGAEVPLGRWGEPEDVASAVAFLASERAGFIVGANIDVDGGHQRSIF